MAALQPRFETLIEMLQARAHLSPDQSAFRFDDRTVSYGQLWQAVNRFGSLLLELGVARQEPILLLLPNGSEFFVAFYGVQRSGATAVPLFPGSGETRVLDMARHCRAKIVVVPSGEPLGELSKNAKKHGIRLVTVAEDAGDLPPEFPRIKPEDHAFLQFTSGSTGEPKGVILTHRNLLANLEQLIGGMRITPQDVFVSWLPCYHDMGLILMTMLPFYLGAKLVLLPTSVLDVTRWLTSIETHRGTFTAAPDFAYRLCLRYTTRPQDYNLSSLRVALNAAEPVRLGTIESFESIFGLENVMIAGYGLAEASVGVSTGDPASTPRVDERGFVSVGRPFAEIDIQIVQDEHPVSAGQTGEIMVKSPANTQGYWLSPRASRALFWRGYVRTGDLGYQDEEGYLYIVGRKKSIILRQGQNIAPHEIEACADSVTGIRYAAAVGIDDGGLGGEQVYLFAELRPDIDDTHFATTVHAVVNAIHRRMGFRPARVYLMKPGSIPLTHNSKLQHSRLKESYLDGSLRRNGATLFPDY